METKAKKKLLNAVMVVLILVIAASGVFTVGKFKGWFDKTEDAVITSGSIKGVANIERKGIGYSLDSNMPLQAGDIIETKKGAQVQLLWESEKDFLLNGNTEVTIETCSSEESVLQIGEGEVFADLSADTEPVQVIFNNNKADLTGAVFSVSVQKGSCALNLYAGDISVILEDGTQERVEAGEYLSVVNNAENEMTYQIADIQLTSLSEFLITQAQNSKNAEQLCFSPEQLQQVLDDRATEKQAALEASLQAQRIAEAKEEEISEEEIEEKETAENAEAEVKESEEDTENTEEESYVIVEEVPVEANICTITILCDTILNNMENLDEGKEAYVPANGTILATSSVEFEEGETVFDVLKRVCEYAGIQLEYSWTAIYDSYYIEGINNLYEFDCGNESGWMYKVNGWFPNYGCSAYELEDGDNIVWCYTCNGLGADVGGAAYW